MVNFYITFIQFSPCFNKKKYIIYNKEVIDKKLEKVYNGKANYREKEKKNRTYGGER